MVFGYLPGETVSAAIQGALGPSDIAELRRIISAFSGTAAALVAPPRQTRKVSRVVMFDDGRVLQ
jgi:hypothetical protein